MKQKTVFLLLCSIIIVSCTPQKSSPLEGTWQFIYGKSVAGDSLVYEFPGNVTGDQIKMWSENHFVFVGKFDFDTTTIDNYGGGTYTLEGDRYEENILYHSSKSSVGQTVKMLLEIRNDTIIQTWPVSDDGETDQSNYNIEKYTRLD
jgi:hypothetical protein